MANVKNFGLIGVGGDLQFAKAGPRIIPNAGTFQLRNATNAGDAALTTAGITSSAGNVTLTTGNLVLTAAAGTVGIAGDTTLSRQQAGVFQFDGTAATMVPSGTAAQRPGSPANSMFRYNSDTNTMEYYNGSWTTLATGGTAVTAVSVVSANGFTGSSSGGTTPALTLTTSITGLLTGSGGALAAAVSGTDIKTVGGLSLVGSGDAGTIGTTYGGTGLTAYVAGDILYASATNVLSAAAPGATSGVQPYDADLTAIAALAGTGYAVQTGAGTWANRSIGGTPGTIVVSNGSGVSANTVITLDAVIDAGTGTFVKVTTDSFGRVSGTTAVVAADITPLVDATYVNVSGDTMTGSLNMGSTNKITNLAAPTAAGDAANKAYVDAVAEGLHVHAPTQAVAASNQTATYANGTAGVGATLTFATAPSTIDGFTLVYSATESVASRIMVTGQSNTFENGIYYASLAGASGTWTRSTDFDTIAEIAGGDFVFDQEGTVYANTGWVQTETTTAIGTSPVIFQQFSGAGSYTAGDGLSLTGTVFSVNMGAGIATLPSDEVGLDIVAGKAVQLTSTATGGQLDFVLAAGSGLSQSGAGLTIAATSVTNAMLANSVVTITGTSGSDPVALGESLAIIGDSGAISTAMGANSLAISARLATTAVTGVASFSSTNFAVSGGGAVSLAGGGVNLTTDVTGILPVANGGSGASTLLDTAVLIGNGTGAIEATTALTFVTDTLTVGGASGVSIQGDGTDAFITALATNGDVNLVPNGTGSVVIGPAGAGLIQSESTYALTVAGDTGLTLQATSSGDITMVLSGTTANKVTISGPTAVQYATSLADEDLVNKYYVDTVAGSATGDIKGIVATFSLAAVGTFNIGAVLPAGCTVLKVKANVTAADTGTGTLSVGVSGDVAGYMTTAENDTQTVGMYISETAVVNAGVQVIATVAGTPAGAGSVTVYVEYQIA